MPVHDRRARALHPLQLAVLSGSVPLFAGAALADLAYASSQQIQWSNFASWLLVGALLLAAVALLWAVVDLVRGRGALALVGLLLLAWLLGLWNTLVHARDAWAMMPTGPILSTLVFALMLVATWFGASARSAGARP